MKIRLLGKDGQVGWEPQRAPAPLGRAEADFSRRYHVQRPIAELAAQGHP